jgi:hypothetical protein
MTATCAFETFEATSRIETTTSDIYAVYPTNRLITPVIREFVEHLIGDLRTRGVAG